MGCQRLETEFGTEKPPNQKEWYTLLQEKEIEFNFKANVIAIYFLNYIKGEKIR